MATVTFTIFNKDQIVAKLLSRAEELAPALVNVLQVEMNKTADHSRQNYFLSSSGPPVPSTLHRRSGNLSRAINARASAEGKTLTGSIGVSTSEVPYAPVHELGLTINVPEHSRRMGFNSNNQRAKLLNKNGSVRAAILNKGGITSHTVRSHKADYPARPFLRPAMNDRGPGILDAIASRAMEILRK